MNIIVSGFSLLLFFVQIILYILENKREIRNRKFGTITLASGVVSASVNVVLYEMRVINRSYVNDAFRSLSVFLIILELLLLVYSFYYFNISKFQLIKRWGNLLLGKRLCSENSNTIIEKKRVDKSYKWFIISFITIAYMIFVLGVIEPYYTNMEEWRFAIQSLVIPMIVVSGIVVFLGTAVSILLSKKYRNRVTIFLTVFILLFYAQKVFFNGRIILAGNYLESGWCSIIINVIIWFSTIGYALLCVVDEKKERICHFIVIFILVIQLPVLPYLIFKGEIASKEVITSYEIDGADQFQIGNEENIIVFIMDRYYSGFFNEYLYNNPDSAVELSDFIYFENMSSRTSATAFSMPYLLTACDTDFSIPLPDSNKNAWNSETANYFYSKFHDNGYNIGLYTDSAIYSGGAENMLGKIDNIKSAEAIFSDVSFGAYLGMLRISFFNVSPLALKNIFCVLDEGEINSSVNIIDEVSLSENIDELSNLASQRGICFYNNDYYDGLKDGLRIGKYSKRLIFQHIFGAHDPFEIIDESAFNSNADSDEAKAVEGCMLIFGEYINQLKELGVYDSSTIILTADHGLGTLNDNSPVMLIKPACWQNDCMIASSVPGDLQVDLLPTILCCGGYDVPSNFEGVPLFLIEDMNRVRITRTGGYSPEYKEAMKVNGMGYAQANVIYEYEFTGRMDEYQFVGAPYTAKQVTSYWW